MNTNEHGCPACGSGETRVVTKARSVTAADGVELKFEDTWCTCKKCKHEFYTRDQSLASSRASADAKRKHTGLLGPSEIKAIRDKYGVTQVELEKILGTGPKTVVRWERGTVSQGKAVDTLLTVLAEHPNVFWALAERRGVVRGPANLRVAVEDKKAPAAAKTRKRVTKKRAKLAPTKAVTKKT